MTKEGSGKIHLYCGDGKGKTTAAVGLAVRAAGRGRQVLIVRFLKTEDSGEVAVLRKIPGIRLMPCRKTFGFTFQMSREEREEAGRYYTAQFLESCELAKDADLLILDEILAACNTGLVNRALVNGFLKDRPEGLEVVLTGRDPWPELLDTADYITEMRAVRHPYEKGVGARESIEY